ncbi:MAG TPA: hypothetical protein DCE14_00795 [Kosmotogaceae bacterium]|nr:hypothetical protein [Kosmotogaceae bacterium]
MRWVAVEGVVVLADAVAIVAVARITTVVIRAAPVLITMFIIVIVVALKRITCVRANMIRLII